MDPSTQRASNTNIMIVDDTPANLRLLSELLKKKGYQIRPFLSGILAIEAAKDEPPDLFLLDVSMPDMDGYEVCRRLKAVDRLREIPIIFISALDEIGDKIRAFAAGGVDYITKPFQAEEVHARVMTHLELRQLQKDIRDQNRILELKVKERTSELLTANEKLTKEIEERIKLEKELIQSQKMEAVGRLAGGVAHDFNNILMVIEGYSDFALRRLKKEDPLYREIEEIKKAGHRASSLTRQLLAFSRHQVVQPQILNLNTLIKDMYKMLCRLVGEDVEIKTIMDPSLRHLKADPGQIEQILMNLAVNSRDAMPKGGRITLETANVFLDESNAFKYADNRPGTHVMLSVGDTGSGIDPKIQEQIFEPFFTTKEPGKGTGLGLSTVYGIVSQNGGVVTVASELDRGTTFRIFLPSVDEPPGLRKLDRKSEDSDRGTETILLVEDDTAARQIVMRLLQEKGYTVLEASNGIEALQVYKKYENSIHLLLTDVIMPGISGRELYEQIRSFHANIRVLFMSGYTDDAIIQHGVFENGIAFLQKPVLPADIIRKVRDVLDRE